MRQLPGLVVLILVTLNGMAQQDATASNYNKIQQLPGFTIWKVPDSTAFTHQNLNSNQPVILVFFSPDCEHCQRETKELIAYKTELKPYQLLMISPMPMAMIRDFYKDYNIASMPNIIMEYDPEHKLSMHFPLRTYPGIFIYDNKGKLAKAFVGNAGVPSILDALK